MKSEFLHVGLTVSDIDKTAAWYGKYFGFELEFKDVFSEEFISSHNALYNLPAGTWANFGFLKSPDGVVIELFEFHPAKAAEPPQWSMPGFHHICLKVPDYFGLYERMKADGVEFFFPPDQRATPEEHWVFLKDPDGNLIELQD